MYSELHCPENNPNDYIVLIHSHLHIEEGLGEKIISHTCWIV